MWITSMCNHGAAGCISEPRHSSCSSYNCLVYITLWICNRNSWLIALKTIIWLLALTHWGRVTHIYFSKIAWSVPSHYLNECWNIVKWALRNKLHSNCYWNSNVFIQENAFENVIWEMSAILSQPQCVNCSRACPVYVWDLIRDINMVITMPADGLAPNGVRPSAGTVLIALFYTIVAMCLCLLKFWIWFCIPDYTFHSIRQHFLC